MSVAVYQRQRTRPVLYGRTLVWVWVLELLGLGLNN